MSCPDPGRRLPIPLAGLLLALAVLPGCNDPAPSTGESTSSSTTGEPPPIPCDDDMPCPEESQTCLVEICHDGPGPTVTIVSPIVEQQLPWTEGAPTQDVTVHLEGSDFTLVAPADDPDSERGSGQIVLTLDNFEVAVIESGDLGDGIDVTVSADALPGAHRLRAFARLSDGTAYDNADASYHTLFWFNDGKPHAALNSPLPGQIYTPGPQTIEISLVVINFELAPASADIAPGRAGVGHIFTDQEFPQCAADEECAEMRRGVLSPQGSASSVTGPFELPAANGNKTRLSVLLARTDHSPYCVDDAQPCVPVFDSITIGRLEPMMEDETTSTSGADTTGAGTGATDSGSGG